MEWFQVLSEVGIAASNRINTCFLLLSLKTETCLNPLLPYAMKPWIPWCFPHRLFWRRSCLLLPPSSSRHHRNKYLQTLRSNGRWTCKGPFTAYSHRSCMSCAILHSPISGMRSSLVWGPKKGSRFVKVFLVVQKFQNVKRIMRVYIYIYIYIYLHTVCIFSGRWTRSLAGTLEKWCC